MRLALNSLSRLLITFPVLVLPVTAALVSPVGAEALPAEEAVRILAKARAADLKCRILSDKAREELSRYAARAEIALANKTSAAAARSAVKTGASQGRKATCDLETQTDIEETLAAAREAIAVADMSEPRKKSERKPQTLELPPSAGKASLARYAQALRAYYLERQCRHLSRGKQNMFWLAVVRLHKAAVSTNGAAAVASLMRQAEAKARKTSCGARSFAIVEEGYGTFAGR